MSTRGFTLIEVFITLVILGILSSVGLFKYIDFRQQAYAASVAADLSAVKIAALTAWTDSEQWPPDAGPGIEPPEIRVHLTGNVTFINSDYTLDWDNLSGGRPQTTDHRPQTTDHRPQTTDHRP